MPGLPRLFRTEIRIVFSLFFEGNAGNIGSGLSRICRSRAAADFSIPPRIKFRGGKSKNPTQGAVNAA
jgi:hypothetical protein